MREEVLRIKVKAKLWCLAIAGLPCGQGKRSISCVCDKEEDHDHQHECKCGRRWSDPVAQGGPTTYGQIAGH